MLSQLVVEMDALAATSEINRYRGESVDGGGDASSAGVILVGVTSNPAALDPALRRPGRLEHTLYVPRPSRSTRRSFLLDRLARMPLAPTGDSMASAEALHADSDHSGDHPCARTQTDGDRGGDNGNGSTAHAAIGMKTSGTGERFGDYSTAVALATLLAARTEGWTCADLTNLCQRAALGALQRISSSGGSDAGGSGAIADESQMVKMSMADFEQALDRWEDRL